LMFMLIVRFLTGFADGPIYPLMTSVLTVQGDPKRFATYIGIIQFSVGLVAGVLAPILTVKLAIYMNWQYAFIFTSLPAVIVGIIIWFVLKEIRPSAVGDGSLSNPAAVERMAMQWKDVPGIFAYRNCTLSYIANILIMIGFWGVVTFGTTYWNHEGGLTLEDAAWLGTVAGIVGLVWAIVIPIMLDRLGRKLSASIFTFYIALSMFVMFVDKGMIGQTAFVLVIGCCGFVSVLFVAIICQESVPPAIAATTTAIGMALGEFFGTSLGPQALGALGDWYELRIIFLVGGICATIAFFITLALTETRKPGIKGNPPG
jgi:ACS family hexuronate transporter-like MFS transporter